MHSRGRKGKGERKEKQTARSRENFSLFPFSSSSLLPFFQFPLRLSGSFVFIPRFFLCLPLAAREKEREREKGRKKGNKSHPRKLFILFRENKTVLFLLFRQMRATRVSMRRLDAAQCSGGFNYIVSARLCLAQLFVSKRCRRDGILLI